MTTRPATFRPRVAFPVFALALAVLAALVGGSARNSFADPPAATSPEASPASNPSALAKAAYEAGVAEDWDGAIAGYRKLVEMGVADPALFYNLGTAYARKGDRGRAVWMLLRARALAPGDRDIRDNLNRIAPDIAAQVAFFPIPPLEFAYRLFALNGWARLGQVALVLSALSFAATHALRRSDARRVPLRKLAIGFAAVALLGHAFAGCRYYEEAVVPRGVIVGDDVRPSSAPSEDAAVYEFVLPPGTVVVARYAGVEGWVKAVYGGDNEVFVRRENVEYLRL